MVYKVQAVCKRGHDKPPGRCETCRREAAKFREAKRRGKRQYTDETRAGAAARARRYRSEEALERREARLAACRERSRQWRKAKPGHRNFLVKSAKAAVKIRTPKWADLEEIRLIYESCPSGWHVDHVIPLRGTLVSGLHVESNLRPIPARVNLSKKHKWTPRLLTDQEISEVQKSWK